MKKQKQKTIYIYCIYFPTSGKYYIGQTINLERRMSGHLNSKYPIGNAMRKYDDYEISTLHKTKSQKKANQLEIAEIAAHKSIRPGGYNLASGGSNGNSLAGKTEEEMERFRKKCSVSHKGVSLSEEARAIMKAAWNQPEVKERRTAKQMHKTIPEYRKWKAVEETEIKKYDMTKGGYRRYKKRAKKHGMTVSQYIEQKAVKKAAKEAAIKKYGLTMTQYKGCKQTAKKHGMTVSQYIEFQKEKKRKKLKIRLAKLQKQLTKLR